MVDLYRSAESALSIILNPKMLKAGKALKEMRGIPYVCMAGRYNGDDIAAGYEEIFRILSIIDYSKLFKGRKLLEKLIQESKEKFFNISYIAIYPEFDTLPVAMFLSSLGMIPELLHVEEFNEDSIPYKEGINALERDPYIAYITNKEQILEAFDEPVNLSFGNCQGLEEDNIISDSELVAISSLGGFERSQALLNLILNSEKMKKGNLHGTL